MAFPPEEQLIAWRRRRKSGREEERGCRHTKRVRYKATAPISDEEDAEVCVIMEAKVQEARSDVETKVAS